MKKKGIIAALLLVAVAAATMYLRHDRTSDNPSVLRLSGNVELTEVQASFKIPGRVLARQVDEGVLVKRGEVLARLEDAELVDALKLARADADAAATGQDSTPHDAPAVAAVAEPPTAEPTAAAVDDGAGEPPA